MLHHLLYYLLTLINPQLLTILILDTTITTVTYVAKKKIATVFNKYHLWTKSANAVTKFW